jgi:hypothetical protein
MVRTDDDYLQQVGKEELSHGPMPYEAPGTVTVQSGVAPDCQSSLSGGFFAAVAHVVLLICNMQQLGRRANA